MEEYGEVPVTSAIVATSSVSILGALLLLGLSVVAKPAHPATRGTRIAWYLTGFAALVLLSSHIPPLVAAIRAFVDRDALRIANHRGIDLGTVTFALQGLTLIFEIVACRSIFYATLPMSVTRRKKRTFIILDMFSFGALVGTFIGALAGTVDNEDRGIGLCGYRCQYAFFCLIPWFMSMTNCVHACQVRRGYRVSRMSCTRCVPTEPEDNSVPSFWKTPLPAGVSFLHLSAHSSSFSLVRSVAHCGHRTTVYVP